MAQNTNHNKRKSPFASAIIVAVLLIYGLFTGQIQDFLNLSNSSANTVTESNLVSADTPSNQVSDDIHYRFRNKHLLEEHFEKHGSDFDYKTAKEYEEGADRVIHSNDVLHKLEVEDNDDVYYLEASNEFVIVSTDGYIRTYFKPSSGKDYFNRQ